jgi:hypothetical protein
VAMTGSRRAQHAMMDRLLVTMLDMRWRITVSRVMADQVLVIAMADQLLVIVYW